MADKKKGIPSPFMPSVEEKSEAIGLTGAQVKQVKDLIGSDALFLIMLKKGNHKCSDPTCTADMTPIIAMDNFAVPDLIGILERATADLKKLISTLTGGLPPKE